MTYCVRCVYPEHHPLGLVFDDNGICSGCRVHEEKDQLNWDERFTLLEKLVRPYKAQGRSINDCIVPVSGARDSYFIVHVVKNILGLNPLLVTYNKHYNTELGIRNLSYLKTSFGCNLLTSTISPDRVNRITRETLRLMGSIYWHCLAGQTALPVQVAYRLKIPLIIWGCHQGVDQVGMYSHLDQVEMTRKYRKEHDLMTYEAEDLLDVTSLGQKDLEPFQYPHDLEIEAVGVRGIYLNNYIRWDSKAQHEQMIAAYSYETLLQQRTFDTYNDVDCFHYSGLHDYIKILKNGYSKVSDHATREIRFGRITREQGVRLVKRFQETEFSDLSLFSNWIEISEQALCLEIEKHRNLSIWKKDEAGHWILRNPLEIHGGSSGDFAIAQPSNSEGLRFNPSSRRTRDEESLKYKLLARGWVDSR